MWLWCGGFGKQLVNDASSVRWWPYWSRDLSSCNHRQQSQKEWLRRLSSLLQPSLGLWRIRRCGQPDFERMVGYHSRGFSYPQPRANAAVVSPIFVRRPCFRCHMWSTNPRPFPTFSINLQKWKSGLQSWKFGLSLTQVSCWFGPAGHSGRVRTLLI